LSNILLKVEKCWTCSQNLNLENSLKGLFEEGK